MDFINYFQDYSNKYIELYLDIYWEKLDLNEKSIEKLYKDIMDIRDELNIEWKEKYKDSSIRMMWSFFWECLINIFNWNWKEDWSIKLKTWEIVFPLDKVFLNIEEWDIESIMDLYDFLKITIK